MSAHPRFKELLAIMEQISSNKNSDYANDRDLLSNFRMCENFGVPTHIGIMTRLSDKYSRICRLLQKGNPVIKDERLGDTVIDLANYALLFLIAYEESTGVETLFLEDTKNS